MDEGDRCAECGVGCVQNFEPAWTHAVGADTSTLYQAASLTKQVTAHAALTLSRRGKLDLDRPLVSWVDDLPNPLARTVTPRQVLSHSSGFPNWRYVSEGQPLPELVPAFAPGSQYQYSGEGYFYLQRVLEEIAGRGFGEVVRELVFEPFGMKSSTLVWDPETLSGPRCRITEKGNCELVGTNRLGSPAVGRSRTVRRSNRSDTRIR